MSLENRVKEYVTTGKCDLRGLKKGLKAVLKMSQEEVVLECVKIQKKRSSLSARERTFCLLVARKIIENAEIIQESNAD